MEVLASILGAVLAEPARLLCGSIYTNIRNTFKFHSNLNALKREMENLVRRRNEINEERETADKEDKLPTTQLEQWLREVEGIKLEVNSMTANMTGNGSNFCGCNLNCCLHYRLRQKVAKNLEEVRQLMKDSGFPTGMVAVNRQIKSVEYIPGPSIESQTTASKNLAEVMDLLNREGVRRIGIWGMGGVGKTTLVQNLNNKLRSDPLNQLFGIVIWVTVSKQLDLKKIQTQIAERLKLAVTSEESEGRMATKLRERLEKEKRFLLILDDVWKEFDLDSLGVPQPEIDMGSKIILTTRSFEVCNKMETNENFKVGVLNEEEAWELFTNKAGKVASLERIKASAKEVARECNGLPLALITVGRAMRGKELIELWKNALRELRRSEPCMIEGIESDVYKPLKLSYDSLQGKNMKPCFLYCSLFPEDFPIEVSELVECWWAEGLIDEQQNYEDSHATGTTIIESLKDSCLLEHGMKEGTVKMHDVVRDVAIWIASSMEDGCKSLVRSGIGLSQTSEVELLKSCKRISFIDVKMTTLLDCVKQCPNTSTLLLQGNILLQRFPEQFLQGFEVVRVLNMSRTSIESLPSSISQLGELRALVLRECICLEELPSLGGLGKLQVLDLYDSGIRELPEGMEELSNLRRLDLSLTSHLKTMQPGVLSRLRSLEVLHMRQSGYEWGKKGEVEEGRATVEELGGLEQLVEVSLWLRSACYLDSKDFKWIERLRSFQFLIGDTAHYEPERTKYDDKQVILRNLDLSECWILGRLIVDASNLYVKSCKEIGWMIEYLATNSDGLAGLKCLTFSECDSLGPFRGTCAAQPDLLPDLEELHLRSIKDLECVGPLVASLGLTFSKLRLIEVVNCPRLIYLIPRELIQWMINLEEIKVIDCEELKEVFQYSSGQNVAPDPVLPKLRKLELVGLTKLTSVYGESESCQSLEQLKVINCNQLERLPLTTQNANTIKEIRGTQQWWSKLKWDPDDIKEKLQPFFKPY